MLQLRLLQDQTCGIFFLWQAGQCPCHSSRKKWRLYLVVGAHPIIFFLQNWLLSPGSPCTLVVSCAGMKGVIDKRGRLSYLCLHCYRHYCCEIVALVTASWLRINPEIIAFMEGFVNSSNGSQQPFPWHTNWRYHTMLVWLSDNTYTVLDTSIFLLSATVAPNKLYCTVSWSLT